jgi:5-hydroxyisourate hydrolase
MSDQRSRVTTHVLDAVFGRPAAGIDAVLHRDGPDGWTEIATGRTDDDGRIASFGPTDLEPGVYRVSFAVAPYFASVGQQAFYPEVVIAFNLTDPDAHYHVPLLLSPYAFSTYRGS